MENRFKLRGRPRKIDDVKVLEKIINEYFSGASEIKKDNNGKEYLFVNYPLTIRGLSNYIGINDDSLNEWGKNYAEFSATIKAAKDVIHQYAEEQLFTNPRTTGVIFNLKNNYGWKDTTEQIVKSTNVNTVLDINFVDVTEQKHLSSPDSTPNLNDVN